MKIKLYREFGAGNSGPVFDAFEEGCIISGDEIVDDYNSADCIVVWSVLFAGRMARNQDVYDRARRDGKRIVVLEIGNLVRGESWRVGLDSINRTANWGVGEYEPNRFDKFGIEVKDWKIVEQGYITICLQRGDSLQWKGKEEVQQWCLNQIEEIRKYTERPIVIRPHPRSNDRLNDLFAKIKGGSIFYDVPEQTGKDAVNFEHALSYSYAIVNHSAGPGVQAALSGTPVIVSDESLAYDVGIKVEDIESFILKDRTEWIEYLAHTEWFLTEIAEGIPWQRLKNSLQSD